MDRLQPLRRPSGPCQGYQSWKDLLFLAERYAFYASSRGGDLLHAPVHHEPYALHRVGVESVEHRLFELCGVTSLGLPTEAFFSPGVDVEVFRQRRVR